MQKSKKDNICKKALNFDLDTHKLKEFYPGKFASNAYRDIKRHLKQHDFKWRQGSGYFSQHALSDFEVKGIVADLATKFPWLEKCVKEFDVTDIDRDYSMVGLIKETVESLSKNSIDNLIDIKPSLDEQIISAEKVRDEQPNSNIKIQNIEKNER